jgi:hypothetical protein
MMSCQRTCMCGARLAEMRRQAERDPLATAARGPRRKGVEEAGRVLYLPEADKM